MHYRAAVLGVIVALATSLNLIGRTQTCIPLPLVGGQGSEVSKKVSQPTIPGPFGLKLRSDWNTDWSVPGGDRFESYKATIVSDEGGSFDIQMYLKYSDNTADEFYKTNGVQLAPGKPLEITATSRRSEQPYQVNLYIGGMKAVGTRYTASVVGCK
jgi:hypothetical protein